MEKEKVTLGDQMKGMVGGLFGGAAPARKTYQQIMGRFQQTKVELQDLIAERDLHIAGVEIKISELTAQKDEAVAEKSDALTTLDFLEKFVKG
jgi:hypothetical protein